MKNTCEYYSSERGCNLGQNTSCVYGGYKTNCERALSFKDARNLDRIIPSALDDVQLELQPFPSQRTLDASLLDLHHPLEDEDGVPVAFRIYRRNTHKIPDAVNDLPLELHPIR